MRYYFLLLFSIISLTSPLVANSNSSTPSSEIKTTQNEETTWRGLLDVGPMKLTLEFKLTQCDRTQEIESTLACYEQKLFDFPVSKTLIEGDKVSFEVDGLGIFYSGTLNTDQNEITGTFTQAGQSFPLTLEKIKDPTQEVVSQLRRPQEPKEPFPYHVEEVTCINQKAHITLSGTLTLPSNSASFPTVILVHGSGPNDRNQELCGHKPFLVLADYLTRQGIGVLRFDKRGVEKSTGNYDGATSEDFAQDVRAWLSYLNTRKDINPNSIGLIGHSEGGLIAPMAALHSDDVSFMVLIGAPSVTGEEILVEQIKEVLLAEGIEAKLARSFSNFQQKLIAILKEEPDIAVAKLRIDSLIQECKTLFSPKEQENYIAMMENQALTFNNPWSRFFISYDPEGALLQSDIPILALYGGLDKQVPLKQNLPVMKQALKAAPTSHYSIKTFPKANHLFQTASTGAVSEYGQIEETMAPEVLSTISSWIQDQIAGSK